MTQTVDIESLEFPIEEYQTIYVRSDHSATKYNYTYQYSIDSYRRCIASGQKGATNSSPSLVVEWQFLHSADNREYYCKITKGEYRIFTSMPNELLVLLLATQHNNRL